MTYDIDLKSIVYIQATWQTIQISHMSYTYRPYDIRYRSHIYCRHIGHMADDLNLAYILYIQATCPMISILYILYTYRPYNSWYRAHIQCIHIRHRYTYRKLYNPVKYRCYTYFYCTLNLCEYVILNCYTGIQTQMLYKCIVQLCYAYSDKLYRQVNNTL